MRIDAHRFRSRPRLGLLTKFALVSLVPIVALGVVLTTILRNDIRQRSLTDARESAVLIEQGLVQPRLSLHALRAGLSPRQIRALDHSLAALLAGHEIARIKVWNTRGKVVYATDHSIIGHTFASDEGLVQALAGGTASDVSDLTRAENASDRSFGQLLEVYSPLRFAGSPGVPGAFELYLPYLPITAAIGHDTTNVSLVLLAGLALLYLALFRIVASASGRLRRQAAENKRLALHDPLTGLPNRTLFHERAAEAISDARRSGGRVALMLFDLDRFKEVNDTLGHHNGDVLLTQIGPRLGTALDDWELVARLGGDEFGVLLPAITGPEAARAVAERLLRTFRAPVCIDGIMLDLQASGGIALFPDHGADVETLLQRADVAMYLAKEDHSGCELYSAERDEYSPARLALVSELRRAIDEHELVLHYQPKAELPLGVVTGVEALIRWQHPERGLLLPDLFVPLAERTGLIRELTQSVMETAFAQQKAWRRAGLELTVAVNLSARDLLDLELPDTVAALLRFHELKGEWLVLEITETVILADPVRTRIILDRLSAMGVQIAIDDFGTGYSSLASLKRLPVAEIKVDRSFVLNMEHDQDDAVIVRSTIELARNLGLRVIAEGVENEATWDELVRLGCDQAQGYHLSRPLPAEELGRWLRERAAAVPAAGPPPLARAVPGAPKPLAGLGAPGR